MIFYANMDTGHAETKEKHFIPVACDCWFTSGGNMKPRFLKIQEHDEIFRIDIDYIEKSDVQYFAGIPASVYTCSCSPNGIKKTIVTIQHPI